MFTGIITDIGRVRTVRGESDKRFDIETAYDLDSIEIGASIAHAGVCLTVMEKGDVWYGVEVSRETLSCTTLGHWQAGTRINLERSLCLGDELGGHMVSGHVDGLASIQNRHQDGDSLRFVFEAPAALMRFVAPKGSVALDGVSLTVNTVEENRFCVNIIPHTQEMTTFSERQAGDLLNMEVDMLARYVGRLLETGQVR